MTKIEVGSLLVSPPGGLGDVFLVAEHGPAGSLGFVLGRPSGHTLQELVDDLGLDHPEDVLADPVVYRGGPAQAGSAWLVFEPTCAAPAKNAVSLAPGVALTCCPDVLEAVADGGGRYLVFLGYRGFGPGELAREAEEGRWLTMPGTPDLVFDEADVGRWDRAAGVLFGVAPGWTGSLHIADA